MVRAQASGGENAHRWAVGAISEGVGENMEPLLLTLATWRRGTVRCDLLSCGGDVGAAVGHTAGAALSL